MDRYYLFRTVISGDTQRQEFLATTTDSEHIVSHPLNITFVYEYFVVASNCVGNSSSTANAVVSFYGELAVGRVGNAVIDHGYTS